MVDPSGALSLIPDGYRCYSDASFRDGVAGYGTIVSIIEDGVRSELHRESGRIKARTSLEAELYAIEVGLALIPDSQTGIAWTDLSCFQTLLEGRRSWTARYLDLMTRIRTELAGTGLVLDYMARKARPHEYTECHRMARRELDSPVDYPRMAGAAWSLE